MLESFQIDNFRLFQHLQVERLSRVNLLVGKNNAGKSTFLEAVELYASNASPTVLLDLVESRQETWFSEAQPQSQNLTGNSMRHLFFEHKLPQIGMQGILLGEMSSDTSFILVLLPIKTRMMMKARAGKFVSRMFSWKSSITLMKIYPILKFSS